LKREEKGWEKKKKYLNNEEVLNGLDDYIKVKDTEVLLPAQ